MVAQLDSMERKTIASPFLNNVVLIQNGSLRKKFANQKEENAHKEHILLEVHVNHMLLVKMGKYGILKDFFVAAPKIVNGMEKIVFPALEERSGRLVLDANVQKVHFFLGHIVIQFNTIGVKIFLILYGKKDNAYASLDSALLEYNAFVKE